MHYLNSSQPSTHLSRPSASLLRQRINKLLSPLASLKLTITLLGLAMVLIFAGSTAQKDMSVWEVQHQYFHSWFTFLEWRLFFPLWDWGNKHVPGAIPFPGGYTLIVLLLANLLAAHTVRFKINWKRSGILLIHAGLILLLLGEVVTSVWQTEGQMRIDVGGASNYTADVRQAELTVTDESAPDYNLEVVIPAARLQRMGTIQRPQLPFAIHVDEYFPNSGVLGPMEAGDRKDARATVGTGVGLTLVPQSKLTGTDAQLIDQPSAYVTLVANDGQSLGTYLVSTLPLEPQFPQIDQPQTVKVGDKSYLLQLRYKREYKPYTIQLLKFTHDKYVGSDKPKNFASLIQLKDPEHEVDREVSIWMNHPLRYNGETFYQSGFDVIADKFTILQIVKNPGWLIPYVSFAMVALGLVVHFGMVLAKFLRKSVQPAKVKTVKANWVPAAAITGICAIYLVGLFYPQANHGELDMDQFARIPVAYEGRTMPLDSLARNSLRIISGKSVLPTSDGEKPAIDWLADVFAQPDRAMTYRIFRIDHPEILNLLGLDDKQFRFTGNEINAKFQKLTEQFDLANKVPAKQRDLYQRKIVELFEHVNLYEQLAGVGSLYLSPPLAADHWRTFDDAMDSVEKKGLRDPGAESFLAMIKADHENQAGDFNAAAGGYRGLLEEKMPDVVRKLDVEVLFNRVAPFYQCMILYVIVFLLAAVSWLTWRGPLQRAAFWLLVLTWLFHTLGLITRIYLQGRPPVTNLYSSAIFIGWVAVGFCIAMELLYKNAIPAATAAMIACPTLLIAHYLAGSGDTMEMMQAVLDTNIWLATHVVIETMGYAATFLAGCLAIGFVVSNLITGEEDKTLSRMVYGIVCFAMLFTFVGTTLGGIWADQSWGRFWGWDPKENGAVLIVLWNAIILHTRWAGLIKARGVALMAVFGNIVTSWSWFGTNMMGVGLHSYGFMDSAAWWLSAWVGLNVAVILVGLLFVNAQFRMTKPE